MLKTPVCMWKSTPSTQSQSPPYALELLSRMGRPSWKAFLFYLSLGFSLDIETLKFLTSWKICSFQPLAYSCPSYMPNPPNRSGRADPMSPFTTSSSISLWLLIVPATLKRLNVSKVFQNSVYLNPQWQGSLLATQFLLKISSLISNNIPWFSPVELAVLSCLTAKALLVIKRWNFSKLCTFLPLHSAHIRLQGKVQHLHMDALKVC